MQLDKYEANNILERWGDLIEKGEFESLFKQMFKDYDPEVIGALSTWLYESDVEYLDYMEYVPPCAFYEAEIQALTIPDNIAKIEDFAFAYSKLKSIKIPKSVKEIDETAFYGCQDLDTVEYEGSRDEWYDLGVSIPRQAKLNTKK